MGTQQDALTVKEMQLIAYEPKYRTDQRMTTTYTKTFILCPHCGGQTNSSVDHLQPNRSFGPWHCNLCNERYTGSTDSVGNIALTALFTRETDKTIPSLNLLVLPPQKHPVYFVIGSDVGRNSEHGEHTEYYYNEHSCPTNWLKDIRLICIEHDTDPHGLFRYMRSITKASFDASLKGLQSSDDRSTDETLEVLLQLFPEIEKQLLPSEDS